MRRGARTAPPIANRLPSTGSENSRFSWRRAFLGAREAWLRRVVEQRGEQFHELHKKFESDLRRHMIAIGVPRQYLREFRAIPGPNDRI